MLDKTSHPVAFLSKVEHFQYIINANNISIICYFYVWGIWVKRVVFNLGKENAFLQANNSQDCESLFTEETLRK